jgi:hypothetical protein
VKRKGKKKTGTVQRKRGGGEQKFSMQFMASHKSRYTSSRRYAIRINQKKEAQRKAVQA